MKNTYVTNHNWGSFENNSTVNKLILRHYKDLITYLNMIIPIFFNTKKVEDSIVFLNDNSKFSIVVNCEKMLELQEEK